MVGPCMSQAPSIENKKSLLWVLYILKIDKKTDKGEKENKDEDKQIFCKLM